MEQSHSLREFIYIDNVEINSVLAQLNGRLETVMTKTNSLEESFSDNFHDGGEISGSGSLGTALLAKGEAGMSLNSSIDSGSENAQGKETSKQTVYNDYSVEVLENCLKENELLKTPSDSLRYGDIVKFNDRFDLIDFKALEATTEKETLKKILSYSEDDGTKDIKQTENKIRQIKSQVKKHPEIKDQLKILESELKRLKSEKSGMTDGIEAIHTLAEFGSNSFSNTTLISSESFISYAKNENFRMNNSQLGMLMNNPRKGIIIGVIENKFSNNGIDLQENFEAKDIGKIGSFLTTTLLQNFNLAQSDSYMIKPLAIYFE